MELSELQKYMMEQGLVGDGMTMQKLADYAVLLQEWNQKMNLTAITEPSAVYEKHFLDSLLPLRYTALKGEVADVGSGAGFPGLVWAIAVPSVQFTLIEPTGKRCTFLNEVKTQLSLDNVCIANARAEDYAKEHRESFDLVSARAVAALPVLAELCIPLVKVNGIFLSMKGSKGREEAVLGKHAVDLLGCQKAELHEDYLPSGDERISLVFRKDRHTPLKYPRAYGQIKKKPL